MQLYVKCIQLESKKEISFLFRLFKAFGKYTNNSGLDQAFTEPEIYGPATIEQVNNGKHMKRSLEANTALYVALFCVYMKSFVCLHLLIGKELQRLLTERESCN